jgi:hypothetical protein
MKKNNFARNKKEVTPATEVINSTQQTQTTPSQDLLSPIGGFTQAWHTVGAGKNIPRWRELNPRGASLLQQ